MIVSAGVKHSSSPRFTTTASITFNCCLPAFSVLLNILHLVNLRVYTRALLLPNERVYFRRQLGRGGDVEVKSEGEGPVARVEGGK